MKKGSSYINKRKLHLFYILATPFVMFSSFYGLRMAAADATEILSPLPDKFEYTVARDVVIVPQPTYTIPDQVEDMIRMVFKEDADLMIEVARCESGLNPMARNRESTATGVFQIMASVHGISRNRLENPMVNILVAKELFDASGTNPWLASIHCWGE